MAKRKKTARVQINVRMREKLRARIERAAKARDVSMNVETVDRLERSFDIEEQFGGETIFRQMRVLGGLIGNIQELRGKTWWEDHEVYGEVLGAVEEVFLRLGPWGAGGQSFINLREDVALQLKSLEEKFEK